MNNIYNCMKLKKIVENMDKMPSTLKGFNETPKLSPEQKKKLMEMVSNYNQLGQKLRMENSLIETATALSEISELAETYACNEASDWFATEVVKTDFKRARGISETFQKVAKECHSRVQQLNALYEDMGHILERYYEIADPMQEVNPNPADLKSQMGLPNAAPQTVNPTKGVGLMQEVKPNDKNLQSQRQLPANGPIKETNLKEVHPNDKNIKSQRELPHTNGPAPAQIKEVAPNDKNIKSQRELPHTGGPATPQLKEVHPNDKNIKSQRMMPAGGPAPAQVKETALNTVHQTCKVPGCGRPVQRTLSAELCPIHASPKSVNVKETKVNEVHPNDKNIKSQRDLPSRGPAPAQVKETNLKEVHPNDKNIKSQRDLPSGGPTAYVPPKDTGIVKEVAPKGWEGTVKAMKKHKEIDNPWALSNWMKDKGMKSHKKEEETVNEVKPNDSNIKSQRDLPSGGPTAYVPPKDPQDTGSVKEVTKLPSMQEIMGLKK